MRGYDTVEYAKSRLHETIVMKDGEPVMVLQVSGSNDNIQIVYNRLNSDKDELKSAPLDTFDINPVRLGYVNHKGIADYLMRTPMRRDWRQGLRMINLVNSEGSNPRLVSWRSVSSTIMGQFPTFKTSLNTINTREIKSIAFHRDFAMERDGNLKYKGILSIGEVNMDNGGVLINDNSNWVREAFDQAMENAA